MTATPKQKKNISKKILYSALSSLFGSFMFCLIAALCRTNMLFTNIDYRANNMLACNVSFGIQYTFYCLSKIFLYLFLTFRIQVVFSTSAYKMNSKILTSCQVLFFLIAIILLIGVLAFLPKLLLVTENTNIYVCTGDTGMELTLANLSIIGVVLIDFVCTTLLLSIFVHKLRTVESIS